ncbi:MAG: hypothetical protein E6Q76_12405 [Rhizobium sp.]|nr:MAG: hypothetical protein E6Q76_12405 [Rhizobium sp.]
MLKQTLSIARHNVAFYAVFVACSVGLLALDEYSGKSASVGATLFLLNGLSMYVQNSVLQGRNFTAAVKERKLPIGGYMFRSSLSGLMSRSGWSADTSRRSISSLRRERNCSRLPCDVSMRPICAIAFVTIESPELTIHQG